MPDNTKKKQDAELADAYTQDRTGDELDEYAAAKKRLSAGPVRDADLRYVTNYEAKAPAAVVPAPVTPVQASTQGPSGAPPAPQQPAPIVTADNAARLAAPYSVAETASRAYNAPTEAAQALRSAASQTAKEYATGGAPGLFVGALSDIRRRRR